MALWVGADAVNLSHDDVLLLARHANAVSDATKGRLVLSYPPESTGRWCVTSRIEQGHDCFYSFAEEVPTRPAAGEEAQLDGRKRHRTDEEGKSKREKKDTQKAAKSTHRRNQERPTAIALPSAGIVAAAMSAAELVPTRARDPYTELPLTPEPLF